MTTTTTDLDTLTGDYTLDPAHSRVGFVARHAMVTKVRGLFKEFEGELHLDAEDPTRSSADVHAAGRLDRLRQARPRRPPAQRRLLRRRAFPTITFVSTAAEAKDERPATAHRRPHHPGSDPPGHPRASS